MKTTMPGRKKRSRNQRPKKLRVRKRSLKQRPTKKQRRKRRKVKSRLSIIPILKRLAGKASLARKMGF